MPQPSSQPSQQLARWHPLAVSERLWPVVSLGVIVCLLALLVVVFGSQQLAGVATVALINLVFVVATYMFVGNSGILSFGHMAFAAIGAYTAAILTIPTTQKEFVLSSLYPGLLHIHAGAVTATIAGAAAAAIVAAVLALPIMRLTGIAAALATLAILVIFEVVSSHWQQLTNGSAGISSIPITTGLGAALVWSLLALAFAFAFQRSRWGRRLRAAREDEVAARALGIGVLNERRIGFVISAFFAGVAGALMAQYLGSFTPGDFYIDATFLTLAMLVVGGMTSLSGAVIGTVFISVVAELLRRVESGTSIGPISIPGRPGVQDVGLALVMLLVLIRWPRGLTQSRELTAPRRLRR